MQLSLYNYYSCYLLSCLRGVCAMAFEDLSAETWALIDHAITHRDPGLLLPGCPALFDDPRESASRDEHMRSLWRNSLTGRLWTRLLLANLLTAVTRAQLTSRKVSASLTQAQRTTRMAEMVAALAAADIRYNDPQLVELAMALTPELVAAWNQRTTQQQA